MADSPMRAVVQDRFGGPEVLHVADRPAPRPLPTEVRVRVHAAGVNPVDWWTRAGAGMAKRVLGEPPFILGWDASGVVDAVGMGVTRFAVGDEVYGMPWFPREAGCYAELITAPSRQLARKPATIGHEQAGALPLAGLTAWQALVDTAEVRTGQRVLVHAASGGVGHLAVQIAKARGAYVLATARAERHALLGDLGVDEAVDYTTTAFERVVRDVDVVVDLVGGATSSRSLEVLRPGGLLVAVASGAPDGLGAAAAARRVRLATMLVEPDRVGLERIAALVDAGDLRVVVDRSFPLEQAAQAHRAGERGHNFGKTVLVAA